MWLRKPSRLGSSARRLETRDAVHVHDMTTSCAWVHPQVTATSSPAVHRIPISNTATSITMGNCRCHFPLVSGATRGYDLTPDATESATSAAYKRRDEGIVRIGFAGRPPLAVVACEPASGRIRT